MGTNLRRQIALAQHESERARPLPPTLATALVLLAVLLVLPSVHASRADAYVYWTKYCGTHPATLKKSVKQFGDCDSPRKYRRLDEGKFKFQVRAIEAAGNIDPTPAKDKFKVVD